MISYLSIGLIAVVFGFYQISGGFWTRWDHQLLDVIHKNFSSKGLGPELSAEIFFLEITDATYTELKINSLNRGTLAKINRALSDLGARKIIYDIIFAYPSDPENDAAFERSIAEVGNIYLPAAFEVSPTPKPKPMHGEVGTYLQKLNLFLNSSPKETGRSNPIFGSRPLASLDRFYPGRLNSGHINLDSDPDGVYRQIPLVLKVNSGFVPALGLSIFLDAVNLPFDRLIIDWGDSIQIPVTEGSRLTKEIKIPIDEKGQTTIPFFRMDSESLLRKSAHAFLKDYAQDHLHDELADRFVEGRFVFIADLSQGIPDVGMTPVHDEEKPLVFAHAALLNGLRNDAFYREWSSAHAFFLVVILSGFLVGFAMFKNSIIMYLAGAVFPVGLWLWAGQELAGYQIFPVATSIGSTLFLFSGLVIGIQVISHRDQQFIKNAFSKYVSPKVVDQILAKPELLNLGGEERVLTAFFSDLSGFTGISEKLGPKELVALLNEYLTEMTNIILKYDGTVDKFEGDAILAFFGAPVPFEDHALRACRVALEMQSRLQEMRATSRTQSRQELFMRIGLNTGSMVIGNMGSKTRMDYTMMGDSVNLAARLEGVNKKYGTEILISQFTFEHLNGAMQTRELDRIRVVGKSEPVTIYEVLSKKGDLKSPMREILPLFQQGRKLYCNRHWEEALVCFEKALVIDATDGPSLVYRQRCINFRTQPPKEDWDGVHDILSK